MAEVNYWEESLKEALRSAELISEAAEKSNLVRVMAKTQKLINRLMTRSNDLGYVIQELPLDVCNVWLGIGSEGLFMLPGALNENGEMESLVRSTGDLRCLAILTARQQQEAAAAEASAKAMEQQGQDQPGE